MAILNEYVVKKAGMLVGKPYVYGAKIPKNTQPADVKAVDCSGLVQWTCQELGLKVNMVGNSQFQYEQCIPKTVAQALKIPGALLFRYNKSKGRIGHVAVSDGKGGVVEARGAKYGVVKRKLPTPVTFTAAGLIPGVLYI